MTRRKLFLLSGLLAACAISLGFIVPQYLPSPIQAEIEEFRNLIHPIDDEAAADDLDPNPSQAIEIDVTMLAFNATKARTTLSTTPNRSVCGAVKNDRLLAWADRLLLEGYTSGLGRLRITTLNGGSASVVSGGETPVLSPEGQVIHHIPVGAMIECKPRLRKDGSIHLQMQVLFSALKSPPVSVEGVPQLDVREAKGAFVLRDQQSCFAVLPKRKAIRTTDHIPVLSDLPWIGGWLTWQREVEIEEELLMVMTARRVWAKK